MSEEPKNARSMSNDPHGTIDNPRSSASDSMTPYRADEEAGTMIGPYKLLQMMGEGGMGAVWMAQQTEPVHRRVALKIIKSGMAGEQVLARFEAERQALAMMDHPNIAKVLDAGATAAGRPYFVMELVKGISFTKFCDQEHLTPNERIDLFIPVCHAVQHAHQKGIIHRDLKPSNVLIALYDGKPVPKVIDFGIAKATTQNLTERTMFTEVGQIIGTLEYMAPEQAEMNNLDIDTRADIYSLGVMLYELLTGSPPFSAKQLRSEAYLEMLRLIREVEPQRPSTKLSKSQELPAIAARRKLEPKKLTGMVQGDLDWIVMKCLEKDRARRYETANQLGQELQRYLADEPVQAGPPSAGYRMRKFLRRNKGPAAAVSLVVFALVAGVIGTTLGLVQAEWARAAEAEQRELAVANAAKATKAADEAARAQVIAEKHLEQNKKAQALIGSLLKLLEPRQMEEAGVTGREPLNKKLDRFLEEKVVGDPLTLAQLQNTLGLVLISHSKSAEAIERFKIAYQIRKDLLGKSDPETLQTMEDLGTAYYYDRQGDKAAQFFEEILVKRKAMRGPGDPDTLRVMVKLADAYMSQGNGDGVVELHESILSETEAKFGPNSSETLIAMDAAATSCLNVGRKERGLSLYKTTLSRREVMLAPDHPEILQTMDNLANAYIRSDQPEKGLDLYRFLLKKREDKFGADHIDTLNAMERLAFALSDGNQVAKSIDQFEVLLKKRQTKLGADDPGTLTTVRYLADACVQAGQHERGIKLLQSLVETWKAKLGAEDPTTLFAMEDLASAYIRINQPDKGIDLYVLVLAKREAKLGRDDPDTLRTMDNLASVYLNANFLTKGIDLYESVLKRRRAKLSLDHPDTLRTMDNLAFAYLQAGLPNRAVELFKEELDQWKGRLGPDHPSALQAMENLANAHAKAKQFDKALELYDSILVKRKARPSHEYAETLRAIDNVARECVEAKQVEKAIVIYLSNREKWEARFSPNHSDTLDNLFGLGHAYLEAGTPGKGISVYEQYLAGWRKQVNGNNLQFSYRLEAVGDDLLKHDQFAAAEPIIRELLDIRSKDQQKTWDFFYAKSMLGGSLLGRKKYKDAEPLLIEGYEGMKEHQKTMPLDGTQIAEALERLVQLYNEIGNSAQADRYRKELAVRKAAKMTTKK